MMPRRDQGHSTPQEIARLKKRRDELLNIACTRSERKRILREVRRINRTLREMTRPGRRTGRGR